MRWDTKTQKIILAAVLIVSAIFFCIGLTQPILITGLDFGPISLKRETVYLIDSFQYFRQKGETFIAALLLFFTLIFPVFKYLFIAFTIAGLRFQRQRWLIASLEIINKWSMLDVFVVAVLILNLKFDSTLITSELGSGTRYFAFSVLLLMLCSFFTKRLIVEE